MGYIYKITNNINNKIYIGQTKRNIDIRWKEHLRHIGKKQMPVSLAMLKYGVNNFTVSEIENCEDNILESRENYWIKHYKSNNKNYGYNATVDSKVYSKYTNEDKKIILNLWNDGIGLVKIAKKTGFHIETVRLYLNKNNITKEDIRARANDSVGKSKSKPIIQYDLQNNFIKEWNSITEAAKELGFDRNSIGKTANRKRENYKDFIWKFK